MSDDLDYAPELPRQGDLIPAESAVGRTEIRTLNNNQGAVRVAVKRDLSHVRMEIAQLASWFGDQFEYKLPFKKQVKDAQGRPVYENGRPKKTTEIVSGPSIRCTTAVARAYGNCDTGCEPTGENAEAMLFSAWFLDIETGFRLVRPFRQRKDQNIGGFGGDRGRVIDTLDQVGVSKATRNVIRNALPDLVEYALNQARESALERIKQEADRYRDIIKRSLERFSIPLERVERFYQTPLERMEPPLLAQLIGLLRAVRDGMRAPADVCPEGEQAPVPGQPMPETQEAEREFEREEERADDQATVAADQRRLEEQLRQSAQEPRQAPPEERPAETPAQRPAGRGGRQAGRQTAVAPGNWKVYSHQGQELAVTGADPDAWLYAFEYRYDQTAKDNRPLMVQANLAKLRELAETLEGARKYLP